MTRLAEPGEGITFDAVLRRAADVLPLRGGAGAWSRRVGTLEVLGDGRHPDVAELTATRAPPRPKGQVGGKT